MEADKAIENTSILEDNNQGLRTQALDFNYTSDPPDDYLGMEMEEDVSTGPTDDGALFGEEGFLLNFENDLEVVVDRVA